MRRRTKDLFTASDVAKFCQVDLKTIHNWAERGTLVHFRTPGRHLRFRRLDLLDFLRRYGYPIPAELEQGEPKILLVGSCELLKDTLSGFRVQHLESSAHALVAVGRSAPDVVVLDSDASELTPTQFVDAVVSCGMSHVRVVVWAEPHQQSENWLQSGASAVVTKSHPGNIRQTVEALTGKNR